VRSTAAAGDAAGCGCGGSGAAERSMCAPARRREGGDGELASRWRSSEAYREEPLGSAAESTFLALCRRQSLPG
jgi:hypothetical protein